MRRSASLLVIAVLAAVRLAGATPVEPSGDRACRPCANFAIVSPGLYRGAEPGAACMGYLVSLGIRTVVNLRDEEDASERERAEATALGIQYVHVPMSGFGRPALTEVQEVLGIIQAAGNQLRALQAWA
ncbi:MAG: fused DSP-PTPase phosphatase/NAD kinase-like protein [Candidatus Polarisedimenticolia bacterium]